MATSTKNTNHPPLAKFVSARLPLYNTHNNTFYTRTSLAKKILKQATIDVPRGHTLRHMLYPQTVTENITQQVQPSIEQTMEIIRLSRMFNKHLLELNPVTSADNNPGFREWIENTVLTEKAVSKLLESQQKNHTPPILNLLHRNVVCLTTEKAIYFADDMHDPELRQAVHDNPAQIRQGIIKIVINAMDTTRYDSSLMIVNGTPTIVTGGFTHSPDTAPTANYTAIETINDIQLFD